MRKIIPCFLVVSLVSSGHLLFAKETGKAKSERSSRQVLLQSPAGKLYQERKYDQALEKFRKIEEKEPRNPHLQSFIGYSLYHLNRYSEAREAFQKASRRRRKDLLIRYYLADCEWRLGDAALARQKWESIVSKSSHSVVGQLAKSALEADQAGKTIPPLLPPERHFDLKSFVALPAAKAFKKKAYPEALAEFQKLAAQFPEDVSILRYLGKTQRRLGRNEEAAETLRKALEIHPLNMALHYDLAAVYRRMRRKDLAAEEYRFVAAYDESGIYAKKAREQSRILSGRGKAGKKKRWKLVGGAGWQFDDNATRRSNVSTARKSGDASADRYRYNVTGIYRLWKRKRWALKSDAFLDHSFFDDHLNRLNAFIHGAGLTLGHASKLYGKPLVVALRQGITHTIKKERSFNLGNTTTLDATYRPAHAYKVSVYDRWGYSEYFSDGPQPSFTSHDAFENETGLRQQIFPTSKENLFLRLGSAYTRDWARGNNFDRHVLEMNSAIHVPLFWTLESEVGMKYKHSDYPRFSFPARARQRRGDEWDMDVSLICPLSKRWKMIAKYSYVNANDRNNSFQYDRNIYSTELAFSL